MILSKILNEVIKDKEVTKTILKLRNEYVATNKCSVKQINQGMCRTPARFCQRVGLALVQARTGAL